MSLDLGFDTIGNATVIAYDRGVPVLATDPWVTGTAYFGSWRLSHAFPPEQAEAARAARHVWFSHGHPDHLNGDSLPLFRDRKVLLPDHYGGRICRDLQREGFDVEVLADRRWVRLSDRVRVQCISDFNQDGILLIDIGGRLVVNLNDAWDNGWAGAVREAVARHDRHFLLNISGYGDADMINFWDEDGARILPEAAARAPVGRNIGKVLARFGARRFIPFSSMHRYQRRDSVWTNDYVTELEDYERGFDRAGGREVLPAFLRYDCVTDRWTRIDPPRTEETVHEPEEFGDHWADPLERDEVASLGRYIRSIEHLGTFLDFVRFQVGGREHVIELAPGRFDRGLTFEVPRGSLMTAVRHQVFDDLLIGNFMRTTLHGRWPSLRLYPDFVPYVAKYADNGGARASEELRDYFAHYRRRAPFDYFRARIRDASQRWAVNHVPPESRALGMAREVYHVLTGP